MANNTHIFLHPPIATSLWRMHTYHCLRRRGSCPSHRSCMSFHRDSKGVRLNRCQRLVQDRRVAKPWKHCRWCHCTQSMIQRLLDDYHVVHLPMLCLWLPVVWAKIDCKNSLKKKCNSQMLCEYRRVNSLVHSRLSSVRVLSVCWTLQFSRRSWHVRSFRWFAEPPLGYRWSSDSNRGR